MGPVFALIIGLLVLLLVGLGLGFAAWLRFQRSPERAWRDHVEALVARFHAVREATRIGLEGLKTRREQEIQSLFDQWFDAYLARLPVQDLERFPGIGPATIDKLRDFRFATLKDIKNRPIAIPGIGEKRLGDIRAAAEQRIEDGRAHFRGGEPREAERYSQAVQEKERELDRDKRQREMAAQVLNELNAPLDRFHDKARQITFWNYLAGRMSRIVPAPLRDQPLPQVDRLLAEARTRAEEAWARAHSASVAGGIAKDLPFPSPAPARTESSDRPAAPAAATSSIAPAPGEEDKMLDLTVQFAFLVARCDGHLARKEKEFIGRRLEERCGEDRARVNRVRGLCAYYESAPLNVEDCFEKINTGFSQAPKKDLVGFAWEIARCTGEVNRKEARFLESMCRQLGVEPPGPFLEGPSEAPAAAEQNGQAEPMPAGEAEPPYDPRGVLEMDPATLLSVDLVRRHYHRLMEKFDPQKMADMGPEFIQMAERKRRQVEEAAKTLMAEFGEELNPTVKEEKSQDLRHNPELDDLFGA